MKMIALLRSMARIAYLIIIEPRQSFTHSGDYWHQRYKSGGNSGPGSYHKLAEFKAAVLNGFVKDKHITTIIEYGCGNGNQLRLSEYPSYIGFDVSPEAISQCKSIFSSGGNKAFKLVDAYANETAELTLSLDVLFHLIENNVFFAYMDRLFDSSTKFAIIYSSNTDNQARLQEAHVKHRKFSHWIEQNKPEWKLIQHIPNRYPYSGDSREGSFADFFIYEKAEQSAPLDH